MWWLFALLTAAALSEDEGKVVPPKLNFKNLPLTMSPGPGGQVPSLPFKNPWEGQSLSGGLPEQAKAALLTDQGGGAPNDIRIKGAWFNMNVYSKGWFEKRKRIRFYGSPPGIYYVHSEWKASNVSWMARCPPKWYPKYGVKDQSARVSALNQWISRKADWDTFTGIFEDAIKAIPEILEAAGLIAAAVGSQGQSAQADTSGQVEVVENAIKEALKPIGNVGKSVKKRRKAAAKVTGVLLSAYREQMERANPWAIDEKGNLNTGKRYKRNPQTYEELFMPGDAHPLLYNPPALGGS